jgi:adenylylsulfate kinase-like enzyme
MGLDRPFELRDRGFTATGGIANRWTTSIHTNTYTSRTDFEYHGCALWLTGSGGAGRSDTASIKIKVLADA